MTTRLPEYTALTSATGGKQAGAAGRETRTGAQDPAPKTRHPRFVTIPKYFHPAEDPVRLPNLSLEMKVSGRVGWRVRPPSDYFVTATGAAEK